MRDADVWPEWIETHSIADNRLADAYEGTSDRQHSLCKAHIASLWAMSPPGRISERLMVDDLAQVGGIARLSRPLRWVLLCVDASTAAPAMVLAALVPAITAGVSDILVAGIGPDALSDGLLTALELVGQERVVELDSDHGRQLVLDLSRKSELVENGLIMCLGSHAERAVSSEVRVRMWSPRPRCVLGSAGGVSAPRFSLGVFMEEALPKECIEDMAFLLPGVDIQWWSPTGRLGPRGVTKQAGDFDRFGQNCFDAVLVPDYLSQQAIRVFPVVLGPGRAGHWLWPDLILDRFLLRHVAMF